MTSGTSKTDSEAYEMASRTADAQRANLPEWQRNQISDDDMQIGETWFVWGFYCAMTDDIERRKRLLVSLSEHEVSCTSTNSETIVEDIAKTAERRKPFVRCNRSGGPSGLSGRR